MQSYESAARARGKPRSWGGDRYPGGSPIELCRAVVKSVRAQMNRNSCDPSTLENSQALKNKLMKSILIFENTLWSALDIFDFIDRQVKR